MQDRTPELQVAGLNSKFVSTEALEDKHRDWDGSASLSDTAPDELGRFGRLWIEFFGRRRHSIALDEIERAVKENAGPAKGRMASLIRRLSLASGARYETARRQRKRNRTSIISIIILSMYAILFSMAATLSMTPTVSKEMLSMFSLFMASFIIAFSVYEASKRYDARSEISFRSGLAMQKLRDRAATTLICGAVSKKEIRDVEDAYHQILAEYADNPALLDATAHLISIGKIVGPRALLFKVLYMANIWAMPIIAILSPAILFLMFKVVTYFTYMNAAI